MNNQKHSTIPRSGYDTSSVWNLCTCSSPGEHPGFFFKAGAPLRNGVTKNTNMKKKAFVQAISYCELLTIHINTADYSAKLTFLQPLILQPRLMFYFNTNTLQIFFYLQNTGCIAGEGTHPLHPPPRSAPVQISFHWATSGGIMKCWLFPHATLM